MPSKAAAEAAGQAAAAIAADTLTSLKPQKETFEKEEIGVARLLEGNTPVLDLKGVCAVGTGP
eukprot:3743710-Pleurochrysis_carterae.AAC.1